MNRACFISPAFRCRLPFSSPLKIRSVVPGVLNASSLKAVLCCLILLLSANAWSTLCSCRRRRQFSEIFCSGHSNLSAHKRFKSVSFHPASLAPSSASLIPPSTVFDDKSASLRVFYPLPVPSMAADIIIRQVFYAVREITSACQFFDCRRQRHTVLDWMTATFFK
jgi:hypothetical protein